MSLYLISSRIDDGPRADYMTIHNPTWAQVEQRVRMLDGKRYNEIGLYPSKRNRDSPMMSLGGGQKGRVLVGFQASEDDDFLFLLEEQQGNEELVMDVGGQETVLPGRRCVSLELALKVVKYFFETGRPDPEFTWVP